MLLERLREARKKRAIVGFCKWKDGDGFVLDVDAKKARFELVHPDGTFDEEIEVPLREISRLEHRADYAKRLELFAMFTIPKSKGETTKVRRAILERLRVARRTGECVDVRLEGDPRRDCRVLRIDRDWIELEEHGDDPRSVAAVRLVRLDQIAELRWRSTIELAVTMAWKAASRKRR